MISRSASGGDDLAVIANKLMRGLRALGPAVRFPYLAVAFISRRRAAALGIAL